MARTAKKNIYEKIEEKKNEIIQAEEVLKKLNEELQELFKEQDRQEMELLLLKMKENGLSIEQALKQLSK